MNRALSVLAILLGAAPCAAVSAQSATIESLGYLDSGDRVSAAYGVSPDGKTVVGISKIGTPFHAFRWTLAEGIQDLGTLGSATRSSGANAVSPGGTVVGYSGNDSSQTLGMYVRAFGGMKALPGLGDYTLTYDISDDSSTLVGQSLNQDFYRRAVRWTNGGTSVSELGTIGNFVGEAGALQCSADGSTIAGYSWNGNNYHACLFRPGQPPLDLGSIAGQGYSVGYGISANGVMVVGDSEVSVYGPIRAFLWTSATGKLGLGTVDAWDGASRARAVSADGKVIVGLSENGRSGGFAAVWINRKPRQLWDLLVKDYKANLQGWTSLDETYDISRDGSVLVGVGTYDGASSAFRITLRPNKAPTVAPPTPVSVECNGSVNTVVLSAKVNDGDATDRLTVSWGVGGVIRKTEKNVVPGSSVTFSFNYPDGASPVWIGVSDGKAAGSATTKVTVVDTKSPIVVVADDVRVKVDRGKVFASGINLKTPFVTDVCDPTPQITNDAKAKYPIGTTNVTWTVRDKAGNVATAVQRVIVKNDPPVANAGADVTIKTTDPSVTVKLNGKLSKDPNGHKLKYLWKAPGAKLTNATKARPIGVFKVGTTRVTLTVTDEAGAKSTDLVLVKIRAARMARTAATLADASVRESQMNILDSYQRGRGDALNGEGLALAASAHAIGSMAGDDVGADKKVAVSPEEMTTYLSLRDAAAQQARMAGERFYQSFLVGGDENALAASMYAYYGSGMGFADLSSGDVHEALVHGAGVRDFLPAQ